MFYIFTTVNYLLYRILFGTTSRRLFNSNICERMIKKEAYIFSSCAKRLPVADLWIASLDPLDFLSIYNIRGVTKIIAKGDEKFQLERNLLDEPVVGRRKALSFLRRCHKNKIMDSLHMYTNFKCLCFKDESKEQLTTNRRHSRSLLIDIFWQCGWKIVGAPGRWSPFFPCHRRGYVLLRLLHDYN